MNFIKQNIRTHNFNFNHFPCVYYNHSRFSDNPFSRDNERFRFQSLILGQNKAKTLIFVMFLKITQDAKITIRYLF